MWAAIAAISVQIVSLAGIITGGIVSISKVFSGQRCLLRSEMLRIYYKNRGVGKIRQYEFENFVMLYEAYKKLKGNSFIDKVYDELKTWEVVG
jgi:hypothetical protein